MNRTTELRDAIGTLSDGSPEQFLLRFTKVDADTLTAICDVCLRGTGVHNSVSSGLTGGLGACASARLGSSAKRRASFFIRGSVVIMFLDQRAVAVLDLPARAAGARLVARQALQLRLEIVRMADMALIPDMPDIVTGPH